MFKILKIHLHYDVIVTSHEDGWYLFWYEWKEETHYDNYTSVQHPEGVATTPPLGGGVTKYRGRGLTTVIFKLQSKRFRVSSKE